jgi:hypothetical protein
MRKSAWAVWTALAFALSIAVGCAGVPAVPRDGEIVVHPGEEFRCDGHRYRLLVAQDDYVIQEYVKPEGTPGEVSGWLRQVFRLNRASLAEGRWYMDPSLEGVYVNWRGENTFAIARGDNLPGGGVPVRDQ